eukprot:292535_1
MKSYEPVESIKKRNSVYGWMSKILRETVELFGGYSQTGGWTHDHNILSGPFYSGMGVVMNMPSFNIRLCSPTSTSCQIEVAIKFSGDHGIIIQLDNPNVKPYCWLTGFNCSWISRYKEEDERLFFGGFYPVNIQSVRIRHTQQNFKKFIYALHYLDTMITGGEQAHFTINEEDISVIKNLFANALNKNASFRFDRYIYETFATFIYNKKQIVLDLHKLYEANSGFRDLIMDKMNCHSRKWRQRSFGDITEKDAFGEFSNFTNLFLSQMLSIFKNVNNIIIKTTSDGGTYGYSFSMVSLLTLIKLSSLDTITLKANTHYWLKEYNWIKSLWHSEGKQINQLYERSNYNICVTKHTQAYWLEINKKT